MVFGPQGAVRILLERLACQPQDLSFRAKEENHKDDGPVTLYTDLLGTFSVDFAPVGANLLVSTAPF